MSRNCWIWESDSVIPSETAAGQRVLDELADKLQQSQWGQHDVFSVRLAVEEAIVNAIKHGNRNDASKRVRITCRVSATLVRIEIGDEGPGFDPSALPDPTDEQHIDAPNGRGVMPMRSFMSLVAFNDRGNQVVMEKRRNAGR